MNTDLFAQIPEGVLSVPEQFAEEDTTIQTVEHIEPWKKAIEFGYHLVTNDSLLRWEIWPNWGDYYAYRRDVIGFRQGTLGRLDAFEIDGYSPLEQKVSLNGLSLNSPITGYVNYNHIPANRINNMSEFKGAYYYSEIHLRDYYLIEPLSYLNFDEASDNFRNLEFMVAQNFHERTNIEISFWDRRDGGNYADNEVQGSQIIMKGYHYLKKNIQIRALILRNQFEMGEPFGYEIENKQDFIFNRFTINSNIQNITSDNLRRDINIGIYVRKDSLSEATWGVELQQTKDEFRLPFTTDTLAWDLRTQAVKGFMNHTIGKINLNGNFSINRYNAKKHENFTISSWKLFELAGNIELNLSQNVSLYLKNQLAYRSDYNKGYHSNIGIQNLGKIILNLNLGLFSRIPTIQHMYWISNIFSGSDNLNNTNGISLSSQ